jgi:hypothetical protein
MLESAHVEFLDSVSAIETGDKITLVFDSASTAALFSKSARIAWRCTTKKRRLSKNRGDVRARSETGPGFENQIAPTQKSIIREPSLMT